jgi:2-polyprenyl-6-methoxyphenol hydroxylase-like FAD-dependent oxidoreductase
MNDLSILVVGAGPVGLLTTLRLAQAGIQTTCVEALDAIDASPRAMAYHPISVKELDRAGVLDDCRRIGSQGRGVCWRNTKTKEMIAEINRATSKDFPYENLTIGQHLLAEIILDHLKHHENAKVLFSTKVTGVDQSADGVNLTVEDSSGASRTLSATYCVAADGGRSTMRGLLDITFDGFTYEEQLVSTNVYFDFASYGWRDGNFMVDPEHWALIGRINNEGLWRVSYGEKPGLTHEQVKERMPWKFGKMFPGEHPPQYKLDQMSPYRLNQRCASMFKKGRVMLAGDAAHLCNPFGGLGLTGGILDAAAVADSLIGIYEGKTSDAVLDKYAEVRRQVFTETVNPTSQANKMRLHDNDPDTVGDRDPFLHMLRTATEEERQHVRANAKLAIDMSQYFDRVQQQTDGPLDGSNDGDQQGIGLQGNAPQTTAVH